MFAEVEARCLCLDRLEEAADILGSVGLGVPEVDVARPVLKEDQ
jgi:hypothetical protein